MQNSTNGRKERKKKNNNPYNFIFFWQKQNEDHSFKLIEYIRDNNMINIAKNVNDESANKLTAHKLIAYNGKMPTNNMIKSKSSEYSCFRICNVDAQIIDWICDCLRLIFQQEANEHRTTRCEIKQRRT